MNFQIIIAVIALGVSCHSWADSLSASDALKQLIERHESKGLNAAPTGSAHSPTLSQDKRQEVLRAGETLDGFIRRTWPGLPSKEIWVRKAFVDMNPAAFVQGNPNLLKPGASLLVPGRDEMRASFAAAHPQVAALFEGHHGSKHAPAETSDGRPSQRWVRFP